MVDGQIPISYNDGGGGMVFWPLCIHFPVRNIILLFSIHYRLLSTLKELVIAVRLPFGGEFWFPSELNRWTLTRVSTFSSLCFSRNIHKMCPSILHEAFWDQVCYIIGPDDLGRPFRLTRWFCSSAYFLLLIDFLSFFMIVIGVILVTTSV